MFTFSKWDKICKTISSLNKSITLDSLRIYNDTNDWIAIKHDVETNVKKALTIAKIEAKHNLKSTFYFQGNLVSANHKIIQEISSLGHEIAYHHDVMDANGGNIKKAIQDFQENIANFNKYGFYIKTVCPHGNPVMTRNGWNSNKDFFRDPTVVKLFPNIIDIVVQLPNSYNNITYISDAGYNWKEIINIQGVNLKNTGDLIIKDSKKLFELIKSNKQLIISTHPHRWESSKFKVIFNILLFKVFRNVGRALFQFPFLKKIITKYYYLAKKI